MDFTAEFLQLFFRVGMNGCIIDRAKNDRVIFGKMLQLIVRTQLIAFFERPWNAGCDAEYFHFRMLL
jgi:hypothetical protein